MTDHPSWWQRPRRIAVVTDNDGWMLTYSRQLVQALVDGGDDARLYQDHRDVPEGAVAFYLSCHEIIPPDVLARNRRNLVAHASDLPRGRGMSPLTWQILEGCNRIPVCLLEAVEAVDAGPVIYREYLDFEGHELIDEMRDALGRLCVRLCRRFLDEPSPPEGEPQSGTPSYYRWRTPADSALDPGQSIAEQFNHLRVADNERYPVFFDWRGHRYRLRIDKIDGGEEDTQ